MRLYRLARAQHAADLTGAGARLHGGRWNPRGVAVLYTAETRALAVLELLVHIPLGLMPPDFWLVEVEVAEEAGVRALDRGLLPSDWRALPAPSALAGLGADWVARADCGMLRVPSAIVEEEHNVLVNPAHPAVRARVVGRRAFPLDRRLRDSKRRRS